MAQKKAAWGIDIGQSSLKALKLQYAESTDQVVAVAFDYVPYPKILSQPDAIPEEIIADSMKTFLSRNSIKDDLIAISVPGHSSLARFIQLPPVEASKLSEIVKYEARQQIPFALEEVIWDFQPLGAGIEESGYLLDAEVGLFAMKRDQVANAMRPFTTNKLEIELVQTAPLALYNVLSFDELGIRRGQPVAARDEYTIVLDMGCDNTTLMISNGGKIWIRNVPIGGNHFTRALTKEMKLSFAKAEHLKCNATKSPDPRAVFQALRPIFNDYVSEIQRSIGYFSSVNRQAKVAKVVGLGNGFKLAGLQKFLQQNLQYEVEKPDVFRSLAGDSVVNAPLFSDNILSFAVPYGLALQALDVTRIHTTLLPPEIASARLIRRKKPWAVLSAAALLVGASVAMTFNAMSYGKVHSESFAAAEKDADAFAKEISDGEAAYGAQKTDFENSKKTLEGMVVGRRSLDWIEVFKAVVDCLPRDDNSQQVELELAKKNQVSIRYHVARKEGDLAAWYAGLPEHSKEFMSAADKVTAPEGSGYVITLIGNHWHHGETYEDQGAIYLQKAFLENLQKWTIQLPGQDVTDVGRLGISHATIVDYNDEKKIYMPKEQKERYSARVDLTNPAAGVIGATPGSLLDNADGEAVGGPGFGSAGAANAYQRMSSSMMRPGQGGLSNYPGAGAAGGLRPEDYDEVPETEFKIEFVYKPIAKADRKDASAEGTPAEGEAKPAESTETN
jgi:type IV pilus assembly protein PilM